MANVDEMAKAVAARIASLESEEQTHLYGEAALMKNLQEIRLKLTAAREELIELRQLQGRYVRIRTTPSMRNGTNTEKTGTPGVTVAITGYLRSKGITTVPVTEVVEAVSEAIGRGEVSTRSTDPKKIVSSTISTLVHRGHIIRDKRGEIWLKNPSA
jgi:hypothetical protein